LGISLLQLLGISLLQLRGLKMNKEIRQATPEPSEFTKNLREFIEIQKGEIVYDSNEKPNPLIEPSLKACDLLDSLQAELEQKDKEIERLNDVLDSSGGAIGQVWELQHQIAELQAKIES
jgi:hypothetical protein